MKWLFAALTFVLFSFTTQAQSPDFSDIITVKPTKESAFSWPFYLLIPATFDASKESTLLVSVNNTGYVTDDYLQHELAALHGFRYTADLCGVLNSICVMPVFPRPANEPNIYTHALDRNTLTTDIEPLDRLDLQLAAMIEEAQRRLTSMEIHTHDKVLLFGFSASAMFVNRFTMLHPQRVEAVAVVSPGGWPLAPLTTWKDEALPYPIGTSDLPTITGQEVDIEAVRQVPHFFLLGEEDTNDSVIYRDSYSEEDEALIFRLFGETPVERWPTAEQLYQNAGISATFKLYSETAHDVTTAMKIDIWNFYKEALSQE